jgi:hypothetical protein
VGGCVVQQRTSPLVSAASCAFRTLSQSSHSAAWEPLTIVPISEQVVWLFLLAIPIACISWTVTHEEVFREPREYCVRKSEGDPSFLCRKFYYLFTCEYCFSHYVTVFFLLITRYKLLYDDWRGYLISLFSLVFVANLYIGLFGKVKLGVTKERVEIKAIERQANGEEPRIHRPAA